MFPACDVTMVPILDGNSEIVEHLRSNICYLISWTALGGIQLDREQSKIKIFSSK